jgi:hypothetical protein
MAKYKIGIQVVETYNKYVIVDADDIFEAKKKVEDVWKADDDGYFYDSVTDCADNIETNFFAHGPASEQDIKVHDSIERYDYDRI